MLPPSHDTTVLRFRIDALQTKVEQIRLKASEVSEAAMRAVKAAMASIGMRDPERGPNDFADDEERVTIPVRWLERAMRPGGGHGSSNGASSKLGWLVTLNIGATLALGAWILATLSQNTTDIAVIKCQLNPQTCPQVQVNRGPSTQ